jgi:hypothetical protein
MDCYIAIKACRLLRGRFLRATTVFFKGRLRSLLILLNFHHSYVKTLPLLHGEALLGFLWKPNCHLIPSFFWAVGFDVVSLPSGDVIATETVVDVWSITGAAVFFHSLGCVIDFADHNIKFSVTAARASQSRSLKISLKTLRNYVIYFINPTTILQVKTALVFTNFFIRIAFKIRFALIS